MTLGVDYIDLKRQAPFSLGALEIRPATREVVAKAGREVLEPRVMQVLVALARQNGEVVSRDDLIKQCWAGRVVGDDAINRCVGRIRRVAETQGGFTLETIMHVGYRLTADPEPVEVLLSDMVRLPASPSWWAAPEVPRGVVGYVMLAVVVFVVGCLAYWAIRPTVSAPLRRVIAVLPFTPLSADPDARLFGDRVAVTVAETLSKMGQPMVPTATSFQYRGPGKASAARDLRAMFVIDGEVVRADGKVRVSIHFDDTQNGTTLFAHTFDETIARADALPDRVAGYIASMTWGGDLTVLDSHEAPAIIRALEQQRRGDLFAAYETTKALAKGNSGVSGVQNMFAWSAVNLLFASPAVSNTALIEEARSAAAQAIRLTPADGGSYSIYAAITPPYLWAEREAYLRKALSITPSSIGVSMYLTWLLNESGRFGDADVSARSAFARFPYHEVSVQRLIEMQTGAGRAAMAREPLAQARRLWPDNTAFLDLAFEAVAWQNSQSDADAFLRDGDVLRDITPGRKAIWSAAIRALGNRRAGDIAMLARVCSNANEVWWSCMVSLAKLGKRDEAFAIAAAAYPDLRATDSDGLMKKWLAGPRLAPTRYLFIPAAAPLRADPRFKDLVERIGLLPYWQNTHRAPDFCATERAPVCLLIP